MSDISAALTEAVALALRADPAVVAAFGSAPVRVFDIVPDNQPEPYLQLPGGAVEPVEAEGFDLSIMPFSVHVWSRPEPQGLGEAQAIAKAVREALPGVRVDAGGRVYAVGRLRTEAPLIDPSDNRTVHVVVTAGFTTAPA